MRLDKYLQLHFDLKSRTYAENLILTRRVTVNGKLCQKPSCDVCDGDMVQITADEGFASQGAYKLEKGLNAFGVDVRGLKCADIGCSNGGFTDVLLRRGAANVLAVDVGECALPAQILESGKVRFFKANARALPPEISDVDFVCSDLSFISLKLVLAEIFRILASGGQAIVLVKPQFELDKSALTKSGIVKDEKLRSQALAGVTACAQAVGFEIAGNTVAPIRYADKNVEYLLHLKKRAQEI